jgi:signal transduction histidine kinase
MENIHPLLEVLLIASHELHSPLATMKMRTSYEKECLLEGKEFDRSRVLKLLETYESHLDRIMSLIGTLTDASALDHTPYKLEWSKINLCALVEDVIHRLQPLFERAKSVVSLRTQPPGSLPTGIWDRVRLEQVFTNLLTNAVKYASPGEIRILLQDQMESVRVVIEDDGPGIPREKHETIFQRYERATTSPTIKGLGLGLYIVRKIITAHGGKIHVESAPGEGARFILELPSKPFLGSLL